MGCVIAFIFLILIGLFKEKGIFIFILLIAGILIWDKQNTEKDKAEKEKEKEKEKVVQERLLKDYGLPIDSKRYRHAGGYSKFPNGRWLYIWRDDKYLNLLSKKEPIEKHQVLLSSINFYSVKGDVRQEVKTEGGNTSLGETIIAEGLLGTAAAMKKNQSTQATKTIDERKTIINATIGRETMFIFFEGIDLYNYLLENIPEKEQSFVQMNK